MALLRIWMFICLLFVSLWVGYQSKLEEMQAVLNSTEVSLHHLTALVDCRSLHMVRVFCLELFYGSSRYTKCTDKMIWLWMLKCCLWPQVICVLQKKNFLDTQFYLFIYLFHYYIFYFTIICLDYHK